jgi:hypothetical protein
MMIVIIMMMMIIRRMTLRPVTIIHIKNSNSNNSSRRWLAPVKCFMPGTPQHLRMTTTKEMMDSKRKKRERPLCCNPKPKSAAAAVAVMTELLEGNNPRDYSDVRTDDKQKSAHNIAPFAPTNDMSRVTVVVHGTQPNTPSQDSLKKINDTDNMADVDILV